MGIRKHGSATGEVTGVEPADGLSTTASAGADWSPADEDALAGESDAAE